MDIFDDILDTDNPTEAPKDTSYSYSQTHKKPIKDVCPIKDLGFQPTDLSDNPEDVKLENILIELDLD